MSAGYVVARENFKEAAKHVSAETDPIMFNLLYGLQALTNQIEADFAALGGNMRSLNAPKSGKAKKGKKSSRKRKIAKKATKRAPRRAR